MGVERGPQSVRRGAQILHRDRPRREQRYHRRAVRNRDLRQQGREPAAMRRRRMSLRSPRCRDDGIDGHLANAKPINTQPAAAMMMGSLATFQRDSA